MGIMLWRGGYVNTSPFQCDWGIDTLWETYLWWNLASVANDTKKIGS